MWSCWTAAICIIVSFNTWNTPMRGHVRGWLVTYGSQPLIESNAAYRNYDLSLYPNRCGVAGMSPSNLGDIVWLRPSPESAWYGPCGVIDVIARTDWHHGVIEVGEIAEIPRTLLQSWGTDYGLEGEAYYGRCPPSGKDESVPTLHRPAILEDTRRPVVAYSAWPYPSQAIPRAGECNNFNDIPEWM